MSCVREACEVTRREIAVSGPIRIAYVVSAFGQGGIERCVSRLSNELDRQCFVPLIVSFDGIGKASEWVCKGVPLFDLEKAPRNDPVVIGRLASVLRRNRVQVVHSHSWGTLVETVLARKLASVRFHVHSERGTLLDEWNASSWRVRVRGKVARWALETTDAVITNAAAVQDRLARLCGFSSNRVQVIPNGVDAPPGSRSPLERCEWRTRLAIPEEAVVVGSVGRLVEVKGFSTAVAALHRLTQRGCNVHLILVGDGPERDRLCSLTDELGLAGRMHLVGSQLRIGGLLSAMDVYLNSSLSEGMSQSVVEAMAAGLAMVVTDVGDNARLVGGERPCGLVSPRDNAVDLAERLHQLVSDPVLRSQLSENALWRHDTQYRSEQMVLAYEKLYSRLLSVPCRLSELS